MSNLNDFDSEFHKSMANLYSAAKWLDSYINPIFKDEDLLAQHFNVLRILALSHPESCSAKFIKSKMLDKGRDLTRLIDKLVQLELAERNLNSENRRQMDIEITEKGLDLCYSLDQNLKEGLRKINPLSEEEAIVLNSLLEKLIR